MKQVVTRHKFGDKDYALVPDRIKEFRSNNPRGDISTAETYNPDGSITFRATIIKDRADEHSARATGSARYSETELKKAKAFEKLETISVGRALANLGYLNDGKVATTEEMEEFEDFKQDKQRDEAEAALKSVTTLADLQEVFTSIFQSNPSLGRQLIPLKDSLKETLSENTKS